MNKDRDTVEWETVLSFVAKKMPAVRREYLKRHLEECEECREKLEPSEEKKKALQQPSVDKPVLIRVVYSAARQYRVPVLMVSSLVVLALILISGWRRSAATLPSPLAKSVAQLSEVSSSMGEYSEEKDHAAPRQREAEPMIARSLALSIVVKDCVAARVSVDALLARHHGYAAELTVSGERSNERSLQASFRIPAGELATAITELRSLGTVQAESQKGEEVTQQHSDLVARLKNSRETEQRLRAILQQRTGKMSDVLEVEQEISRVRGEIEGMEAEQKALEHRVEFATIDLQLGEEYRAQLATPSLANRFRNALVSGFQRVADSAVAIVIFCMNYGPAALLGLALFFFPVRMAWRKSRAQMMREAA